MKKQTLKGFITGVAFTLCLVAGIGTVGAASKLVDIRVAKGGISIYIDETKIKPTDANGKVVEPMIYNGTTYLPVRAVATAFGKEATWDGKTSSVYIGKAPVAEQTSLTDLPLVDTSYNTFEYASGSSAKYKILDKIYTPYNMLYNERSGNSTGTYALDSKYSKLKGKFVISQNQLFDRSQEVWFYDVDKKGNRILLGHFENSTGNEPITVDVNIKGVNLLQVELGGYHSYITGTAGILYDVFLENAK